MSSFAPLMETSPAVRSLHADLADCLTSSAPPQAVHVQAISEPALVVDLLRNILGSCPTAFVDLSEIASTRTIYDRIVDGLTGAPLVWDPESKGTLRTQAHSGARTSDTPRMGTATLEPLRDTLDYLHYFLNQTPVATQQYIVISHAERIHSVVSGHSAGSGAKETGLNMTFLSAMLRLREYTTASVTVVLVSNLGWNKLRGNMVGLCSPEEYYFQGLDKEDFLQLITHRFASTSHLDQVDVVPVFSSYASIVYTTFTAYCSNNFTHFAYLVAKFWPKCLYLVTKLNIQDISRLNSYLREDFQTELTMIGGRRLSLEELNAIGDTIDVQDFKGGVGDAWVESGVRGDGNAAAANSSYPRDTQDAAEPTHLSTKQQETVNSLLGHTKKETLNQEQRSFLSNLPTVAKWLLVASYFAGFNSAKSDVVNFVRVDDNVDYNQPKKLMRKKRGGKRRRSARAPARGRAHNPLSGSRTFPVERLVAIFQAIVDVELDYCVETIDIFIQVNSLIHLRLLERVSAKDTLGGLKLKCPLSRETVEIVAKNLSIANWTAYLNDDKL